MIKTFTSLFFNNNRESFGINSLIKHIFNSITLEAIKMIKIIIRHYIKKFKHEVRVFIYFEE